MILILMWNKYYKNGTNKWDFRCGLYFPTNFSHQINVEVTPSPNKALAWKQKIKMHISFTYYVHLGNACDSWIWSNMYIFITIEACKIDSTLNVSMIMSHYIHFQTVNRINRKNIKSVYRKLSVSIWCVLTSSLVSNKIFTWCVIKGSKIFRDFGYRNSSLCIISFIVIIFCLVKRPNGILFSKSYKIVLKDRNKNYSLVTRILFQIT